MQLSMCFAYPLLYSLFRKCLNKTCLCLVVVWCGRDCGILVRGRKSERESKETHTPATFFYFVCNYFAFFRLLSLGLICLFPLSLHLQDCCLFAFACTSVCFVILVVCVFCLLWLAIYVHVCVQCGWCLSIYVVVLFVKQYHSLVNRLKIFFAYRQRIAPTFAKLV